MLPFRFSISIISIFIFLSCGDQKEEEKMEDTTVYLSHEQKMEILNKQNSTSLLYEGTPYSDSIHKNMLKIDYGFMYYGDKFRFYFNEKGELKLESFILIDNHMQAHLDSAKFKSTKFIQNDTIVLDVDGSNVSVFFLNHAYKMNGRLWKFYPYQITRNDSIFFYCPQETTGDVVIKGKDTTILNDLVKTDSVHAFYIRIPYDKKLRGKTLVFENKSLRIK